MGQAGHLSISEIRMPHSDPGSRNKDTRRDVQKHFVEKLHEEQGIGLSYTWVKTALQAAGLVRRYANRWPSAASS